MKKITAIGLIVALLGIAGIIVSQTVPFTKTVSEPAGEFTMGMSYKTEDVKTKNVVLLCGIALLVAGGAVSVFSKTPKAN